MKSKSGKIPQLVLCGWRYPLLGMCLRNKASLSCCYKSKPFWESLTLFFLYILFKTILYKIRLGREKSDWIENYE